MIGVLMPFWTSILVRTYAWLVLLQRQGLINTWGMKLGLWDEPLALVHNLAGTLIGMVHIMLPFMVFPLYAALQKVDPDLLRAAAGMGASPTYTFWQVFFPQTLPGLLAGCVLVFVLSLGFYITPALLGGGRVIMIAVLIEQQVREALNWPFAAALSAVLLVATFAVYALAQRFTRTEPAT